MTSRMGELVETWVSWVRHRDAVKGKVIELIIRTNERFEKDERERQNALKILQREFYRVALAEKLRNGSQADFWPEKLLERAEQILDKKVHVPGLKGKPSDMRSADEERAYTAVRVRWSRLLKEAQVDASDNRGGANRL